MARREGGGENDISSVCLFNSPVVPHNGIGGSVRWVGGLSFKINPVDLLFSFPFLLLIDVIFQVHSVYDLYLFVNRVLSVRWVFVFILMFEFAVWIHNVWSGL